MRARRIGITDTTLRDAHQSLWATRMRTAQMLPILEQLDEVGYHSLECWGGATFDACLRFLDEDPWERLRVIKNHVHRTPLQMLLRGQNLVGYRHYGDDIVRRFVRQGGRERHRHLPRLRRPQRHPQLRDRGRRDQGGRQALPGGRRLHHLAGALARPLRRGRPPLVEMGADSICIKDMAALLSPFYAEQLITRLKDEVDVPIQLHCHYIGGLAPMTYLKAIEAGVDVIDTATVPLAFGNSQPATEMVVTALIGTPYDSELDLEKLFAIAKYFERVRIEGGWERGVTSLTHMQVYSHQVPGGMISNLESQLKSRTPSTGCPRCSRRSPWCAPRSAFRRSSRRCRRSSARRRFSTCCRASAGTSCPTR